MTILGIDFGLKRIGLAIAQEKTILPLKVIQRSEKLIPKIAKICQEYKIEKIVIGISEGRIAQETKKFAHTLSSIVKIPLEFQDETLTSKEALAKMIEGRKKKKVRQKLKDAFAAACILQEYLERKEGNV